MITLFSILFGLYLTKINGLMLGIQFRIKQKLGTKRAKPFDCTACMSFWVSICVQYFLSASWPLMVLTTLTAYAGGSFIERVWLKL